MSTATQLPTLEQLLQAEKQYYDERVAAHQRDCDLALAEKRAPVMSEAIATINEKLSETLRELLQGKLCWPDDETAYRINYVFDVDGESWVLALPDQRLFYPGLPNDYADCAQRIPNGLSNWDNEILRAINEHRERKALRQQSDQRTTDPTPCSSVAGPYVVKHGIYANKLQDALNSLYVEGATWQEIYLEQGGPEYNGTFTIIAKKPQVPNA